MTAGVTPPPPPARFGWNCPHQSLTRDRTTGQNTLKGIAPRATSGSNPAYGCRSNQVSDAPR
jgi:hypothetical protein